MVSFELGKEIKKDVFRHVTSVQGQRKNSESPGGIEPQTFGFALRCSTSEPQRLHGERGLLRSSSFNNYTWKFFDTHGMSSYDICKHS